MTSALETPAAEPLPDITEMEGLEAVPLSFGRLAWRRFRHHKLAIIGAIGLLVIVISFFVMPHLSKWSFDQIDPLELASDHSPSWTHPFGTDDIGRDLMVRTFKGGQYSIGIALVTAVLSTVVGVALGALAGYAGGWLDVVLGQVTNLFLILPYILVLSVFSRRYGAGWLGISVVLSLLLWTSIGRLVRGLVFQIKQQEFVQAARAAGAGSGRIVFRHVLPNVVGPTMVNLTLVAAQAIALESTLSFLNLGVKPPTPTLGNLLYQSKGDLSEHPVRVLIPVFFIVAISMCINFLGDGLRDALDPKASSERGH